jgi:hypothetical protein
MSIRVPDEKDSFRLLHLSQLISKVGHLGRSISWQQ